MTNEKKWEIEWENKAFRGLSTIAAWTPKGLCVLLAFDVDERRVDGYVFDENHYDYDDFAARFDLEVPATTNETMRAVAWHTAAARVTRALVDGEFGGLPRLTTELVAYVLAGPRAMEDVVPSDGPAPEVEVVLVGAAAERAVEFAENIKKNLPDGTRDHLTWLAANLAHLVLEGKKGGRS